MIRRSARLVALGTGAGLSTAALVAPQIGPMLLSVEPHDPTIYLSVVLVVLLTTALASGFPVLRAVAVDPATILRQDE